jgi:hypothetical protein
MPTNIKQQLPAPTTPNLPSPSGSYSSLIAQQHNGVLRLFFNAVVNALRAFTGDAGAQYLDSPNGLFFDTTSHTPAAANTGYPITFGMTYLGHHVSVSSGSRVTVDVPGIYNFSYSGQLTSTNSSAKNVYLWLRRNGQDIPYSTHFYTISGSGTTQEMNWLFAIDMQAGDYMEVVWATTDTTVTLTATAANGVHPGGSSSVLAVDYAGPLPDPLPTLPTP